MKIQIEHYDTKISVELPDDSKINELNDVWNRLLSKMTFSQKQIEEDIIEQAEEIIANRNKD